MILSKGGYGSSTLDLYCNWRRTTRRRGSEIRQERVGASSGRISASLYTVAFPTLAGERRRSVLARVGELWVSMGELVGPEMCEKNARLKKLLHFRGILPSRPINQRGPALRPIKIIT